MALLLVNDHVLKAAFPGPITGKLSDAAGLVLAPLVVVALGEVALSALGRKWDSGRRPITIAVVVVGLSFATAKLIEPVAELYRHALGALQWPFAATLALLLSVPIPDLRPVAFVADPTDLLALPALFIPLWLGWRRASLDIHPSAGWLHDQPTEEANGDNADERDRQELGDEGSREQATQPVDREPGVETGREEQQAIREHEQALGAAAPALEAEDEQRGGADDDERDGHGIDRKRSQLAEHGSRELSAEEDGEHPGEADQDGL